MHPVPVRAVTLGQGFWYDRRKVTSTKHATMYDLLELTESSITSAKYWPQGCADPRTHLHGFDIYK